MPAHRPRVALGLSLAAALALTSLAGCSRAASVEDVARNGRPVTVTTVEVHVEKSGSRKKRRSARYRIDEVRVSGPGLTEAPLSHWDLDRKAVPVRSTGWHNSESKGYTAPLQVRVLTDADGKVTVVAEQDLPGR